ncbi:MAG TPA: Glu/Leu/Phe/Val dehydrogenase dimerization domain-containing protein [Polyangiaceae bacterium]|nr:Glu/Leu/Phe/Val dehydrogenase dimerization domain-containing protein [Polyangiaceae bacterium]
MSVFEHQDFDGHEHVSFFCEAASGLRAIVAIHSTRSFGVSGGGCRMWPYASDDEALRDALRLSKAMSYKLALADMPIGGAKTVVMGDPAKDKSEALWRALGRAVHRLGGRYIIAEDVGTTPADMCMIGLETPYVAGKQADTSTATAYGVFVGLRTAVARRLDRHDLRGLRVAVQGAGNVGGGLCRHLAAAGARVWVADRDGERARRLAAELEGAETVDAADIHRCDVDVFAPCALGSVLDDRTIRELRCSVVAGGANNPLADDERGGAQLARRGILYAPDFVINAGGVIGAAQEGVDIDGDRHAVDQREAFARTERIAATLIDVFDRAEREGITTHEAAVRMAKEKISG